MVCELKDFVYSEMCDRFYTEEDETVELWDEDDKVEFEPLNKAVTLEDEESVEEESKKKLSFWEVLGILE